MALLGSVSQPLPFKHCFQNAVSQAASPGQHEVLCVRSYMCYYWPWMPEPRLMALKFTMAISHCGISSNATSFTMPSSFLGQSGSPVLEGKAGCL